MSDQVERRRLGRRGILYRTVLTLWIVITFSLGLFVLLIIPYQKAMLTERLRSTAEVIATSIDQVTVTSIVVEDYSSVVDHCAKVVKERPQVLYLVITRKDGFSLVHTANQWRMDTLGELWNPSPGGEATISFIRSDLVDAEVFHYSYRLSYSGIDWGWINVGLSLERHNRDLRSLYLRTAVLAGFCLLAGLGAATIFARRLIRPVLSLNRVTQRIAGGDLTARAEIATRDELENLAQSLNRMAAALQDAQEELENRVNERTIELVRANETLQDNVAERERMSEELMAAQTRLQHLLTASPAVIYSYDLADPYATTFVSQNVEKLLGFAPREFTEDPRFWLEHVHMDDLSRVLGEAGNVLERGFFRLDYRLQGKNGDFLWIRDETRLVRDSHGTPREVVGYIVDVTERRQAEAARQTAESELEEQRTLLVRSDRLRSLGEMAAGIAHELNQPLSGVRGLAEHILIGMQRGWQLSADTLRDRVERIVEQADRMVHIIEHIRLFAREAGKPERTVVQVNEVVDSAIDLLGAQFRSHGLELGCELGEGLSPVRANPFSLEEVLLNLLSNARDAVEEQPQEEGAVSQGRVQVRTSMHGSGAGLQVHIEVSDTGVGIAEEVRARMFDPFFTTKDPDKGTGLGLAISRSIVEELGGRLEVQSTPGEGSAITVVLPTPERDPQAAA